MRTLNLEQTHSGQCYMDCSYQVNIQHVQKQNYPDSQVYKHNEFRYINLQFSTSRK